MGNNLAEHTEYVRPKQKRGSNLKPRDKIFAYFVKTLDNFIREAKGPDLVVSPHLPVACCLSLIPFIDSRCWARVVWLILSATIQLVYF
jgi:hypothetical protein